MLDDNTRKVIGELLREEKNTNSDMLFDLMLYGHITDQDGNQIVRTEEQGSAKAPEKKSVEIEFTEDDKAVIKENTESMINSKIKSIIVDSCNKNDCKYNAKGVCISDAITKYGAICNEQDGYSHYEEKEIKCDKQ